MLTYVGISQNDHTITVNHTEICGRLDICCKLPAKRIKKNKKRWMNISAHLCSLWSRKLIPTEEKKKLSRSTVSERHN